jgi:hypothetical protein
MGQPKKQSPNKIVGLVLDPETVAFFKEKAKIERRKFAAVIRLQLQDIVAAARQDNVQSDRQDLSN